MCSKQKKISAWPKQGIPKRIQLLGNESKPPAREVLPPSVGFLFHTASQHQQYFTDFII